ncbi:MAG: alpha/beta fold hydrolase [Dehalococcoidia bacterium]
MTHPPTFFTQVGDLRVAYRVFGQGAPILLIMGLTGTLELWDPTLVAALARHSLVVAFDNRGMGETANTGDYPFEQIADDAACLIEVLGLEAPTVLGWSTGGSIALDLAVRHPERVGRLVLYAGDCGGPEVVHPSPAVEAQFGDTSGTPAEQRERLIRVLFPPGWRERHAAYVKRVFYSELRASTPENLTRQAQALAGWAGVGPRLATVQRPALIVQGMADIVTPPENAQVLAAGLSGSWLVRMAGAGHGLMYQYPRQLARLVRLFSRLPEG